MLPGLPSFWSKAASTPIKAPTPMIPQRVAKKFFPISISSLTENAIAVMDAVFLGKAIFTRHA
jgi:hypothetical protein